ncbi:MAG: hypothetical protein AAF447_20025 [Myxococcota bacterium]
MARGENEAGSRGHAGLVIGVTFAVACLASLLVVLAVRQEPAEAPLPVTAPAPFVGAHGLLTGLRWRDCVEGLPPPPLEASLRVRGYVAQGPPRAAPSPVADAGLGPGCGLVLVRGDGPRPGASCSQRAVARAHCGDAPIAFSGSESGRTLTAFALPGFSPDDAATLPLDERLAHAEAARLLAAAGYEAGDLGVAVAVTGTGDLTLPLPPPPATGCVALVATVSGDHELVNIEHGGGLRGQSRPAGSGPERRTLLGLPHCAGPGGVGTLRATKVAPAGGLQVLYRAYTPPAGPGARGTVRPLRRVSASLATLIAETPAR